MVFTKMPKIKSASAELRQYRIQERTAAAQKQLQPPSEIFLSVLGNGACGSPRSLYVFTDRSRYLFNCGEGTQRLAHEYKMRLSKLQHIFFTHKSWKNLGGLLGLSLTVQDIGVPGITLHGPPDIEKLYSYSKGFIMTKNLTIEKREHTDVPFVDDCMEVEYIPIFSSLTSQFSATHKNGVHRHPDDESLSHTNKKQKIDDSDDSSFGVAVAYICKGHSKPGHLEHKKCIELGVPSGPLLGELKNGKDVTLPSGKIVRSKDVISEEEKCPIFIVLECPSEDYIDSLLNEDKLKNYQLNGSQRPAALVIHFSPSIVIGNNNYQEWISRFPETTCHLFLNEKCSSSNSAAIHRVQHMLNLIHPKVFSLLHETEASSDSFIDSKPNLFLTNPLDRYYLRPHNGFDKTAAVKIEPHMYIEEAQNTPSFEDSLRELHKNLEEDVNPNVNGQTYPEVIFLGTGSCIPSKVRNVSCILVNTSAECSVLLDCGEGSYNQLLRNFGSDETKLVLQRISCIFISHVHADHHLGLFALLKEREVAFNNMNYSPVVIIAPQSIEEWLENYSQKFEPIASLYRFIEINAMQYQSAFLPEDVKECLSESCKSFEITTIPVNHCPNAFGAVLESPLNWKLVYSGDTTPCQELVDAGYGCSLLIHEATMEDDLEDEAALKMHSTTSQAIEIADKMAAKYTILTHFSQRYAKVPIFNEKFHSHIGIAFDNMRVRPCDLPIISLFIPTLQNLFAEHVEKLQKKGHKRKEKLQQLCSKAEVLESINI